MLYNKGNFNKYFSTGLSFTGILAVLFVISSLISCHNSNNKANNPMGKYSSSIRPLNLPFIDSCSDTLATQKITLPDSLSNFKQYGQVVGKINETKKYIAILYSLKGDVQLPVLYTFTLKGELISHKKLFIGNCCGENEDCYGISTVEITKNLHIILKDSTETFNRDLNNSSKKSNIQLHSNYEEFMIDSTGAIQSVRSSVRTVPPQS